MARDEKGRFRVSRAALDRFLDKCRFDPASGCVEWIAGKTRGRGKTRWYGVFKYLRRRWSAHRWAARYILGLEIDDLEVDHECGNTLCVRHLQAVTGAVNRELYWIRVEVGLEEDFHDPPAENDGIPYHHPPAWFEARYTPAAQRPAELPF